MGGAERETTTTKVPSWRRRARGCAWLVLGVLTALPAHAERRKLAVLELTDAAGLDPGEAHFLTSRVRGAASRLPTDRWFVMTEENLQAVLPPGTDLADCQGGCEVETGRNIGAEVVVSGELARLGGSFTLTLRAHHTVDGALLGQEVATAPTREGLDAEAVGAAARLLARLPDSGDAGPPATLTVRGAEDLDLRVNGVEIAPGGLTSLSLPAGAHHIEASSRCHRPLRLDVTLQPGESRRVDLAPTLREARLRVDAVDGDGAPVDAEVRVDGALVGRSGTDLPVPLCSHVVEVRGAGERWRGALDLRPDGRTGITAMLGAGTRAATAPAQGGVERPKSALWLMVGGAAALGLGTAFALKNREDGAALQDDPTNLTLRDEVDASYRTSTALYVVGAAAVAGGLGWWLLGGTTPDEAALRWGAGPGGAFVRATW